MIQPKITEILTDVPISHQSTEINRQFSPLIGELTDFFFKNKKIPKIIVNIFFNFFFSKINRILTEFFLKYKKIAKIILNKFSENFFYENLFLQIFFLAKIFFIEFFLAKFFLFTKKFLLCLMFAK